MTDTSAALRLLAVSGPGPIQDLLIAQSGGIRAVITRLPNLPGDEDVRRALRNLDVDSTVRVVQLATSPALLTWVLDTDRRVNVRRAVAVNPHLSDDDAGRLAAKSRTPWDAALGKTLIGTRGNAGRIRLLIEHPHLRRQDDDADRILACALAAAGTAQDLQNLLAGWPGENAATVLAIACDVPNGQLPVAAVLTTVQTLAGYLTDESQIFGICRYLAGRGDDTTVRHAVQTLPWAQMRRAAVEAGRTCAYPAVLQRSTDPEELASLAAQISATGEAVDDTIAARLRTAPAGYPGTSPQDRDRFRNYTDWHRRIRMSDAARELLTRTAHPLIAVVHALQHPDTAVLAATIDRHRAVLLDSGLWLSDRDVKTLFDGADAEAALGPERWWWILTRDNTGSSEVSGWAVRACAQRGDVTALDPHWLHRDLVRTIVARDDIRDLPFGLLQVRNLDEDTRRAIMLRLDGNQLKDAVRSLHPGELTWLLQQRPGDSDQILEFVAQHHDDGLLVEVIGAVRMPWQSALGRPRIAAAALQYLSDRLGTDRARWQIAVGLLAGWTRSLADLAGAARQL